mmetsp:Transcript_8061/g.15100  ORF Transcript_8061/g.15100 Transcript_8061/m.15100 type:complete len:213 (+) Transcript_8061:109-747(+)
MLLSERSNLLSDDVPSAATRTGIQRTLLQRRDLSGCHEQRRRCWTQPAMLGPERLLLHGTKVHRSKRPRAERLRRRLDGAGWPPPKSRKKAVRNCASARKRLQQSVGISRSRRRRQSDKLQTPSAVAMNSSQKRMLGNAQLTNIGAERPCLATGGRSTRLLVTVTTMANRLAMPDQVQHCPQRCAPLSSALRQTPRHAEDRRWKLKTGHRMR